MRLILMLATFVVSGCAFDIDKNKLTTLDISVDRKSFVVVEKWSDTMKASDYLLEKWLQEYVQDNQLCTNGYRLNSMRDIVLNKNALGITSYKRINEYICN